MSRASQTSGGAEALAHDVAERLEKADLGRRLEARTLGDHVRAAREQPAFRRLAPHGAGQGLAPARAHGVAHDEQMAAGHDAVAVAVRRHVDEVVDHDEVARVQQVVEAADAGVREVRPDAGPMQHTEDLS